MVAPDRTLTYAELATCSDVVATNVAAVTRRPEAPVALLLDVRAAWPIATLGVLRAGRPYLALDPAAPETRLTRTVVRSGVAAVVACAETLALATRIVAAATKTEDVAGSIAIVDVDALEQGGALPPHGSPDDLAYVYYTSGSTGEPKGVEDTHRSVLHNVMRYVNTLGLGPGDRLTLLQRPAFSGSVSSLLGALLTGATSCLFDLRADGVAALRTWLAEERITVYHSVPSIFREVAPAAATFAQMRVVRLEGDRASPLDLELFNRHFLPGCVLVNGLGATECGLVRQYVHAVGGTIPELVPVGYPVGDVEVAVIDEHGAEVVAGVAGEVVVRSAFLARGYRDDPEQTAAKFRDLGAGVRQYRTGDRGRLAQDGCLELLGRVDRQARFRGQAVETEAIEQALVSAALATQVVVQTYAPPGQRERLVAYVVPPRGSRVTSGDLRACLERELPLDAVPTDFVLLESLPVDSNGKVAAELPPPERGRPVLAVPFVAPRGPVERAVAAAWADVLDLDHVGAHDPFRELGGDSLAAAEMLAEVERRLVVTLPHTILLEAATVEQLAQQIAQRGRTASPVVRVRDGSGIPLVLSTGDIIGGGLYVRDLVARLDAERPVFAIAPFDPERESTPATIEEMAERRLVDLRPLLAPGGRCVVTGYCGQGGVLALELARQLERSGTRVGALILVDTFPPSPHFTGYGRSLRGRIATVAIEPALRFVPSLTGRTLARRAEAYFRTWPRRPAHMAFERARLRYFGGRIAAPIHVLWPVDESLHPTLAEFRRGWLAHSDRVEVKPIPGDHVDVVTGTLGDLAKAIQGILDDASAES